MPKDDLEIAVQRLLKTFGEPSQNTLGTSVFQSESPLEGDALEAFARASYKHFIGDAWDSIGEENWTKNWNCVFRRPADGPADIMAELDSLSDSAAALAASQLTENHSDPDQARSSLQAVFDAEGTRNVAIYRVGDTDAITGVLIAGILASGTAVAVVFLMD